MGISTVRLYLVLMSLLVVGCEARQEEGQGNAGRTEIDPPPVEWINLHAQLVAPLVSGHLDTALNSAREIEDPFWKGYTLKSIGFTHNRAGQSEEGRELLAEATTIALGLEEGWGRDRLLELIGHRHVDAGQLTSAMTIVQTIQPESRSHLLRRIAERQAEQGRFAEALITAEGIDSMYERVQAVCAIALSQAEAGREGEASRTFEQVLATDGIEDTVIAFHQIAIAQSKAGQFTQALSTARGISEAIFRVTALIRIAEEQTLADQRQEARATFERALAAAREMEDDFARWDVIDRVVEGQVRAGLFADALATAERFVASSIDRIPAAQAEAGQFEDALATARGIESTSVRANALEKIALALIESGQARRLDEAREVLAEAAALYIERPEEVRVFLPSLAITHARAGQFDRALELTEQLADRSRAHVLLEIAVIQAEADHADEARETLSRMLSLVPQAAEEDWAKAELLSEIGFAQALAGQRDEAWASFAEAYAAARRIEEKPMRLAQMMGVAKEQSRAGMRANQSSLLWTTPSHLEDPLEIAMVRIGLAEGLLDAAEERAVAVRVRSNSGPN